MTHEYPSLHISAIIEHIEELENEQLNNLVLECVKELYSREKTTEHEYVIREYGSRTEG